MEASEVLFLRDQVQRLNAELFKYQKNLSTPVDKKDAGLVGAIPWFTDQGVLSPLLREYDQTIYQLQEENSVFKTEHREIRVRVEELVQENDRLVKELKDALQTQLSEFNIGESNEYSADKTSTDLLTVNLQKQVQSSLQERDIAVEKWRSSTQEIHRLERALELEKESHQWKVVEDQANQVKSQYYQTASVLNTEIETLQSELRQTKAELTTSGIQLTDSRRTIAELQQHLAWKDQETADAMFKEGVSDGQSGKLKLHLADLKQKLCDSTKKCQLLQDNQDMLESRCTELQHQRFGTDNKESEAVMKVRDAIQMAEKAILEKDQAEIQYIQKEEELEQMQEVVNKLINEAGVRTRQEVDNVRKQSNERISKLTEELHTLEMDNAEKQAYLDRLLREKRAVESELEKVYKEGVVQGNKENSSYHDLNQRAIDAERVKNNIELKLDSLQTELKREKLNSEQLRSQMDIQFSQLKDRNVAMETDVQQANDECMKYQDELDKMKKKIQLTLQEKDGVQRKYHKELAIIEQEKIMKLRVYEVKIQSTEDTNRHAMSELRKILTAQQRMAAKWKEECQSITKKFEVKLQELREELDHKERRNIEITSLLKESQEKTQDAAKTFSEATRNIRCMEERVRESETRALDSTKKLMKVSVKNRQMENEKQSMIQEISRYQREMSRSTKGGSLHNSVEYSTNHQSSNGVIDTSNKFTGQLDMQDLMSERR